MLGYRHQQTFSLGQSMLAEGHVLVLKIAKHGDIQKTQPQKDHTKGLLPQNPPTLA